MTNQPLTPGQIRQYQQDGYLIVRNFLNREEVEKLYHVAIDDSTVSKNAINVNDSTGKRSKLSLWYKPGDDIYGLLTRSEQLVASVDALLDTNADGSQTRGDGPSDHPVRDHPVGDHPVGDHPVRVCHFHSKLMQKEPRVGGAWEWHQDYGYWYKNEFLLPDQMMSVMVAITDANPENGCLQVIKGSHKMGRVEHGFAGEQVGASQRYVDLALKTMELVYVDLKAGDVLFFHSNILHRSEANLSDKPRWSMISCYNRPSNVGYNDSASSASSITPIDVVPNDALLTWETAGLAEVGADFLAKEADVALK